MRHARSHMHDIRRATGRVVLALILFLCLDVVFAQQQGPIAGANVNVISGTGADGDWTLQRQNEPSMACSSRNPRHCLAGANDYRTVDIPFPTIGERVTGDAWHGWYTTKDGGQTWRSRLLPGYPQDNSAAGLASPLKGYPAGADPVVRAGTNGLFFYAGLAFDREEDGGSAIFVARFIDNNNQEGTAGDPIEYLGASIVHRMGPAPNVVARNERGARATKAQASTARKPERPETRASRVRAGAVQQPGLVQLVDKPWIAVDVPRTGAQTCTIGGGTTGIPLQTFPGGRVYIVYTLFDGTDEERGRIMFSSSANCGATWTTPRVISRVQSADVNDDGVANNADLTRVQASYNRTCGQTGYNPNADLNNDCRVDLVDLTLVSRGVGQPVPRQPRLSQGATLAIDPANGALQIAWRQFNDGVLPDAVVTVRSTNGGTTISSPRVVAPVIPFDQRSTDTTFRTNGLPTMTMDGAGRVYLAWSARGYAGQRPLPEEDDARVVLSTSTNGTTWTAPQVIEVLDQPGHQVMPALTFAQGKLQLIYYDLREDRSQLFQRFIDELLIISGGASGIRHTVDVRAAQADPGPTPVFVSTRLTQYAVGAVPGTQAIQQLEFNPPNLPLFRAGTTPFMGDYIDVTPEAPFVRNGSTWAFNTAATGSPVFHGIWTDNRDIRPPANGRWTDYTPPNPPFARPSTSLFDPTQPIPACVPGQAGMRNQNIYTARITTGLIVGALGNSRRLGAIQRTFPVFVQNNSTVVRSYRLTIANQPVGGQASFRQFDMLTTLDVAVPRRSTIARTVFVRSSDPHAQVNVSVVEIATPGGAVVPNGQAGTIVLNPDPTNPDLENPDLENPDLENPDLENAEVQNPDLENATVRNPDLENPDLENPDLENPDLENASVKNPSILNPDLENPDLENPDLENPDLENPDLENADLINGALSDTTWTVTNKGNTAASYTVKLALNRQIPTGFVSQLIAHKVYQTPTVLGCSLLKQSQTVLLANIPNPRFATPGEIANPDLENPDLENLTIALAPGETARITVRMFDPNRSDAVTFKAAESVTPVAVAQAVGTIEAALGVTQPAVAAVLTPPSAPVPGSTVGGTYTTTLQSTVPGTWTVAGGSLPTGVTLNQDTGVISGTPTTPGTYTFSAQFRSTTGLTDYRTVTIVVGGVGASADTSIAATASIPPALAGDILYTMIASNAGPAPATNVVVTDTLPEGTTFVSATTTLGSCRHANGTLQCTLGTMASGGSATIQLRVRPRAAGAHVNRVTIAAAEADPNTVDNTANTSTASGALAPCTSVCFSGPTSFIAGPHDVEFGGLAADFNDDGALDLIVGPTGINRVSILLGNGTGGFGPPAQMAIPGSAESGGFGDFNNDGHLDVVITSQSVAQAWLFLGTGTGAFGPVITVALPNSPENVVVADFDRDGNDDIAVTSADAGPLGTILRGNGNGTFQPPTNLGTTTGESSVATDDFNSDGNPDLAFHTTDAVIVILGSGAAGFQAPLTIPLTGASGILKVGDLTGDGFPDLIAGTVVGDVGGFWLIASNGSGGFNAPAPMALPSEEVSEAPAVGDVDGDGDRDVVWARERGGVGIQLNNGTGVFAAPIYLSSPFGGEPILGDFNGDGRTDIVMTLGGAFQSQVLVFLNTCDQPPADVAVTLTGPTTPPVEGTNFTYAIGVTNNGPNAATGAQFDFTFGQAADFVSITGTPGSCIVDRTHISCPLGTLAAGATLNFTVVVRARGGFNLPSTAGITATTSDPNLANNAAFLATQVTSAASTLVVTNTNESGPGSFWQALADSNDSGPRDTIAFNIPGSGPHTIHVTGLRDLPDINAPVVIDGTTQPGYSGTPLVELRGTPANPADGLSFVAGDSIVRGLAINSFQGNGIIVFTGSPGGNVFESNMIGTDPSGTVAMPNANFGIGLGAANNTIGGTAPNAGNVISGNLQSGVLMLGPALGNTLLRNMIGTDVTGTMALGNGGAGVSIQSFGNRVGSTDTGIGNTIAFNAAMGVRVEPGANGNEIVNNRIFSNGLLGIDLVPVGVTPNDPTDNDTGANTLLNRPVLSSARTVDANVLVQVALSPTPSGPFQVHFYANTACDPSGSGEGQTPIGVASFGANPGGDTNFEASFAASQVPPGTFLTATATDSGHNTSEFSACAQVAADAGTANLAITKNDTPDPVAVGAQLTYTIAVQNLGPNASSAATVTDVLPSSVTLVSASASAGSCSGTTTITCAIGSIANGATVTVSIVVTPTAVGPLSNTATVTASGTDPDTSNNSATATTTVEAAAPSSFIVTNTSDGGPGSLRQAILDANANFGPDTITFNIPGSGVRTILTAGLPILTQPTTIDGTTQPGFSGSPLIELSGVDTAPGTNGLVFNGGGSIVRGLIVNRFPGNGIVLQGGDSNVVTGNWIGVTAAGNAAAANANGVMVLSSANTIGGDTAQTGNVLSGNTIAGVQIGSSALGNVVLGNLIGTDRTGSADVGNVQSGVLVFGEANAVGGPQSGARNVISGNNGAGVRLAGGANANIVQGNLVGTAVDGVSPLANGIGVEVGVNVDSTASSNRVGGIEAGSANLIAFNETMGVKIGQSSSDNAILGNSIRDNGTLGIDLIGNGPTGNDLGDTDEGANNLQNFPILTGAVGGVHGALDSFPDATFRIEYFGNTACDASGHGEGATFLGATVVTTDASGHAVLGLFPAAPGVFVTATATDGSNNTSEFSTCETPLAAAAELALQRSDSPDPVVVGSALTYTLTITNNGPSTATNVTLTDVLPAGVTLVSATSATGSCVGTTTITCTLDPIASGAGATATIVVTPTVIGEIVNNASVSAAESDPVPGNNNASATTTVIGAPSSFVVTNTSDSGAGSLRQAILNANASPGADIISFAIPGTDVRTIALLSPLPTVTDTVTIDGTTQPGFDGSPIVELNGASAGSGSTGLSISAGGSTVRGLVINRFGGAGINLNNGSGNLIEGNYLGTNVAGTSALGNGQGISISPPSTNNTVGGTTAAARNLISGNGNRGISIGGSGNLVVGNYIGTNAAGTGALGNGAASPSAGVGIDGSNNTITGNLISGSVGVGINILATTATGNTIRGNLIGTDVTGALALGNAQGGITVNGPSNTIGGTTAADRNIISGNAGNGINIFSSATGTIVLGNFIGTNSAGSAAVPNTGGGVNLGTSNNVVGGLSTGARNVISGNGVPGSGVYAYGVGVFGTISGNQIQGNFIGLNAGGTAAVSNTGIGVQIGTSASGTLVGGTATGAGNVISGNGFGNAVTGNDTGVSMFQTTGNTLQGNFIGTNAAGTASIPNRGGGITIILSSGNTVGGPVAEARNVISGNQLYGVGVFNSSSGNVIDGNWIGSSATGSALGNQTDGIIIDSSNNTVGGIGATSGNLIAFNTTSGVQVGQGGSDNAILGNSIRGNGALGIDLNGNGITPNDALDADEGGNDLQNFPVLAPASGGVNATLQTTPNGLFRIEFFGSAACDASGNGEGATLLGAVTVTTDASGNGPPVFFATGSGQFVTATATNSSNNTSEFSNCVQAASNARTWITNASGVWENPANWSDGIVPVDGDIVVIDRGAANPIVTVQSATVSLAGLRSEEPLVVTGGALTFTGLANLNGGLTMSGGLLTGPGDIELRGVSSWTGGHITGAGNLIVATSGQLAVNTPGALGILARRLTNNGFTSWNQATLSLVDSARILNATGGLFEIQSNLAFVNNTGGASAIDNHGVLFKSGPGGDITLTGVTFTTTGVLQLRLGATSDRIVSNAPGTLGGFLDVNLQPGFVPSPGSQYDILSFSSRMGTFAIINGNGQSYTPSYTATGLTLTAVAVPIANLGIAVLDSPDPVQQGSTLTYTITVTNAGPDSAADVTMTDTLPASVTLVSATPSQGSCTGTTVVSCSLGTIVSGAAATITIAVTPNATGNINNTAVVTSATQDNVPGNNSVVTQGLVTLPSATFVVTTTADSGPGSLRQAILDANASPFVLDRVHFNIPGEGVQTIAPATFLPTVTDSIFIDGTTQPGYTGTPLIQLDGINAGATSNGLFLSFGGSTVRGFSIVRFGTGGQPNAAGGAGIVIQGPGGGNVIENNYIGIAPDGVTVLANRTDGVAISESPLNRIGVNGPNVLSGNGRFGIILSFEGTTGTIVQGNMLGPTVNGTAPAGSTQIAGIAVFGAVGSTIGGVGPSAANTIAFNTSHGAAISSGTRNTISRNRIFSNGALGINLGTSGITPNDPGDADTGANDLLNFPVLSAVAGGVQGTFNGLPNGTFLIELFTSPSCDANGNGEGANFLTAIGISTDFTGNGVIPFVAAPVNQHITATTTDALGNTSEFSTCVLVTPSISLTLPNSLPIGVGRTVTATVTLSTPAPAGGTVVTVSSDAPTVASIAAPGTVTIPEGSTTGTIGVTGVNAGNTVIRATAAGYDAGTVGVTVTQNLISTPATLGVPLGQTAQLPVSVGPTPAPAGGLTLDVVSDDPSVIQVTTPQITIAAGALSANATVRGLIGGTANVTVTNPQYSPSTTSVTSSAQLNVLETEGIFSNGLPAPTLNVRLEHNGTPLAALTTLSIGLASNNTACVAVPASISISAGLVSTTFQPAYGGTASLPCTATVTVSAPGITSDTVQITVNPAATFTGAGIVQVGAGLMTTGSASIDTTSHGGLTVTIQSNDPTRVLVSSSPTSAGATSTTVTLPPNHVFLGYYVHGLEGVTGSASLTISATGVNSGTQSVDVVQGGIEIVSLDPETTTLSGDDVDVYLQVGLSCGGANTVVCSQQSVRPGRPPLIATLSLSEAQTPIAQLKSDQPVTIGQFVTKPIQPGIYHTQAVQAGTVYGLAFDPVGVGTTTVTVTAPGFTTMSVTGVRQVTISGPGIGVPFTQAVGAGLQLGIGSALGASQHGGVVVTVQSDNPSRVLVSPDGIAAGTASFTRTLANGETVIPYYVQGLENATGSAMVTVSAPGFASASHEVQVVTPGVEIVSLDPSTTTLSADDTDWYVQVGLPCSGGTIALCSVQGVRAGGPQFIVTISLAEAQTPIAQLRSDQPAATAQTVTKPIQPGFYYTQTLAGTTVYGLAFDPISAGSTTATVTGPLGVVTMSLTGVRPVTISGPVISPASAVTVGAGLQTPAVSVLSASEHGGVTVTITSNDPSRVRVSPDPATAGAASINVTVPNGQIAIVYYVQGVENVNNSATITLSAPGFGSAGHSVQVVPIGIEIVNLDPATTNLSPEDIDWYLQIGIPCPGNAQLCIAQPLRAGGPPFVATVSNSNDNVARLRSDEPSAIGQVVTKPIQAGFYHTQTADFTTFFGLGFDPLANGTTNVTVAGPVGVVTMTTSGIRTITVGTPTFLLSRSEVTIGTGLQVATSAFLTAPQHGGVTVTVTSSAPSLVVVSADHLVPGSASIEIPMANNNTFVPIVLQAFENVTGTATVTLSAPGFTSATIAVTVRASGIEVYGLPDSISATSPDFMGWYVAAGVPSQDGTFLTEVQNVRAGSPGFVITLTNGTPGVAQLASDEPPAVGQVVTKPIQPGFYFTQQVPLGTPYGLRFDPIAPGSTSVTATGPSGVLSLPLATRVIVVNP